jgi:putative oxidoreductase
MTTGRDWAALVGRALLSALFIMSGFEKIGGFAGSVAYAQNAGLPMPQVAVAIALVIELVGGLMVLFGFKARIGALAIAVFTLVAAFAFHRYWTLPADKQIVPYLFFWKDLAMAGGMLMVAAFGPGRLSVDRG